MRNERGQRRPQAAVLDPNSECYADHGSIGETSSPTLPGSAGSFTALPGLVAAAGAIEAEIRQGVQQAIQEGVSVSELARCLGVHRATLYRQFRGSFAAGTQSERLRSVRAPRFQG